jgi:uncharacterized protein (PEP-CTERM system associated)
MQRIEICRVVLVGLVALDVGHAASAAELPGPGVDSAAIEPSPPATVPVSTSYRGLQLPPGQRDLIGMSGDTNRAGAWNLSARAIGELLLTNNVSLAPPGQQESDLVLGLSLPLSVRRATSRTLLAAEYVPIAYLYARNNDANNLQNNLRSFASLEAVDDFFFIDAIANIYPTYVSPFLPRPNTGASITSNRTQQTTLGVSPYIQRQTSKGWSYQVRNDSFWNGYSDSQLADSFANRFSATAESPPTRLNYGLDYTYLYTTDDSSATAYYQRVARIRPIFRAKRTVNVSARLGYETNDYETPNNRGAVYGAGIHWTPNARTRLDGFLEHRFFGASYALNLDYRTRRTAWRLRGTRDTVTTIQQPLTQRPATSVEMFDQAYSAQTNDPTLRERLVREFLQSTGIPPSLTQPYSFYTDQVYVSTQWTGSMVLLGRRNSVELALIWQVNDPPITSAGTGLSTASVQGLLQRGVRLNYSHRVSALTSVSLTGGRLYAKTTDASSAPTVDDGKSIQDDVQLAVSHRLGRKTDASLGLRWSSFDSPSEPYREVSVRAAIGYNF